MTAGHCVQYCSLPGEPLPCPAPVPLAALTIKVRLDQGGARRGGPTYHVVGITVHPQYSSTRVGTDTRPRHDIALLQLDRQVSVNFHFFTE